MPNRHRTPAATLAATIVAACAIAVGAGVRADDGKKDGFGPLLDQLRDAASAEARDEVRARILKKRPKPEALIDAIREETTLPADAAIGVQSVDVPGADRPVELFVPETYDPAKRWPVVIGLHGTGGDGEQIFTPAVTLCREKGFILVCPTLPDPDIDSAMAKAKKTGFGWGDHDGNLALIALDWLLRRYRVDTDRVYLLGVSQGGYGAWGIGTCFAWRWAAILPYAGGIDYRENFGNLDLIQRIPKGGIPPGFAPPGVGELAGGGRRRDLLKNLLNTPAFFVHGAKDSVVKPDGDRKSAEEIRALGYEDCRYVEKPDWGHVPKDITEIAGLVDDMLGWAEKKIRPTNPDRIIHFAPRRDGRRAWWIDLDEADEGALVTARIKGSLVEIQTEEVERLTVHLDGDMVNLRKKVKIAVNGKPVLAKKLKPKAEHVLETWERDWDDRRLYPVRVTLDVPE